ncbi:unnamed protein product, partial [Anisakis simplex]|uniref:F-type ATPase subunit delta n=1 Tax=Anisakis simplex TaxID=6269 RepID=A0A0M3J6S0_ANISI
MGFADELQIRFGQRLLANHWLPPSLTPLLRIAAIALRQNIETKQVERTSIGSNTELTVDTIGFMESELQSLRRQRDAKQVQQAAEQNNREQQTQSQKVGSEGLSLQRSALSPKPRPR